MKKYLDKNCLTYILMFIALFILGVESNIYLSNIIDASNYGLDSFRYKLINCGFTISWILIFELIYYLIHSKKLRIIYFTILNASWLVCLVAQIVYCQQMGKYMIFSDLFCAGEGLQYLGVIFTNLNFGMILTVIIGLIINFVIYWINRKDLNTKYKSEKKYILGVIILIVLLRITCYVGLGDSSLANTWQESYNAKSIYNNYTNPNTSAYVSGFYEYNLRSIYKYFYNLVTTDKQLLRKTIDEYNSIYGVTLADNDYTGIFKDKNVIMIMMESIDTWVVDEKTMPTLYNLEKTGINFTNRYSPFFNGGQTINSEFALNSGLYAISNSETIFDLDTVTYQYSLANMLKSQGYNVNSVHANTGTFYNRTEFHNRLGYTHHYSLSDMQSIGLLDKETNYFADSEAISDDQVFDLMTSGDKFFTFYTTYSAHLEYNRNNKVFKSIKHTLKESDYTSEEEYIYRTLANDTDNFLKILIDKLEKKGLLDDTVIVLATDHYVYGYSDTNYVATMKSVANNRKLLQNTPFVIWSKDIESQSIDTIMDTADVVPTLLNMLGVSYDPNNYIGTDVFSSYHDDFVWFSDGEYISSSTCKLTNEAILTKTSYNIQKNKNILLTNYYGKKN